MSKSGFTTGQLRSFIERVERLEEEKAALTADIREVYAEAKATGFDPKTMRAIVRLRKLDTADRQEQEAMLELYKEALGMLADTELGRAALQAVSVPRRKTKATPPHDPDTGEIIEDVSASHDDYSPTARIEAMQKEPDVHRNGDVRPATVAAMPEQGGASSKASYSYDAGEVHGRICEPTSPPIHATGDDFDADRDMPSFLRRGTKSELIAAE